MTQASYWTDDNVAVLLYCTISGLPYIYSHAAKPSAWGTTINGVDFGGWSQSLIIDNIEPIGGRADIRSGLGDTGGNTFAFALDGTEAVPNRWQSSPDGIWTNWAAGALRDASLGDQYRWTRLLRTVEVNDDEIFVLNPYDDPVTVYLGLETIQAGSRDIAPPLPYSWTECVRGCYASQALRHEVVSGQPLAFGDGPVVSSYPRAWRGRIVTLYASPGWWRDGAFVPRSTTVGNGSTDLRWRFVVNAADIDDSTHRFILNCDGLASLLRRRTFTNLPTAPLGPSWGSGSYQRSESLPWPRIQIDNANNRLSWGMTWESAAGTQTFNLINNVDVRLQRPDPTDDSNPASQNVADGLYYPWEIGRFISWTFNWAKSPDADGSSDVSRPWSGNPVLNAELSMTGDPDSGYKARLVFLTWNQDPIAAELWIDTHRSCLRDLGFGDGTLVGSAGWDAAHSMMVYEFIAQGAPASVRWTLPGEGDRNLYLRKPMQVSMDGKPLFTSATGIVDDAGNAVVEMAQIGDREIVGFDEVVTPDTRLAVVSRNQLGSRLDEELFIEADGEDTDEVMVTQVANYAGCNPIRVALYAMLSGSGVAGSNDATYDKPGIHRWGAHIQADLVNVSALETLGETHAVLVDNIAFARPITIDEYLSAIAMSNGWLFVPRAGQLSGVWIGPPLESDIYWHDNYDPLVELAATDLILEDCQVESSVNDLLNIVRGQVAYDHASQSYRTEVEARLSSSISEFGEMGEASMVEQTRRHWASSVNAFARGVQNLFARFGDIYQRVWLSVAKASSWAIEVGDYIRYTHPTLPKPNQPGRGHTEVVGQVIEAVHEIAPNSSRSSRLQLLVSHNAARRFVSWSPAAVLESHISGKTYKVMDTQFCLLGNSDVEAFWELTSWFVRIHKAGDYSTAMTTVLTSGTADPPDDSTMTFADSWAGGFPAIVEFDSYDAVSVGGGQECMAYGNDGSGILDEGGKDDPSHTWL